MSGKSCENCEDQKCYVIMRRAGYDTTIPCDSDWQRIPCPKCGGALSETREHNGRRYRHCYSCHFEFEEDGNGKAD